MQPITISKIIETHFSKQTFLPGIQKEAGRKLKKFINKEKLDEQTAVNKVVEFLKGKEAYDKSTVSNFNPPAKALILAQSRPFDEWGIVKVSNTIQSSIYALSRDQIEELPNELKSSIETWITDNKINLGDFKFDVQILNKIIPKAKNTYLGVIEKVENKNKKIKSKIEKQNEWRAEHDQKLLDLPKIETALDPTTNKLIHPPGISPNIFCCKQTPIIACKEVKELPNIPQEYTNYSRDPNDPIFIHYSDRLKIPEGQHGFIPQWQKDRGLVKKKPHARKRSWFSNQNLKAKSKRKLSKYSVQDIEQAKARDALLCKIQVQKDWVIFDARGLLRNLYWRDLVPSEGLSLNQILQQFTGDPVIDTKRNVITFCYKEGVVDVHSENIVKTKSAPDLFKKLTENQSVGMISIDLGQTNPVSVKFSRISQKNEELVSEHLDRQFLSERLLKEVVDFRQKSDFIRENIYQQALSQISTEYQNEFNLIAQNNTSEKILEKLQNTLNINLSKLPFEEMTSWTFHIANACQDANLNPSIFMFENKKNKKSDFSFAKQFKIKASKEAQDALNEKIWELQRTSPEYEKLSKRKREWARRCVNDLIARCEELSGCQKIVLNIENLNIKIFHGSGKREKGWDNFFKYKTENRWVIQHLHKALSEVAKHQGINVIEVSPHYTSLTCTQCGFCDKTNRDGEKFICQKCHYKGHADLEIATDNLEKVALTGQGMAKPEKRDGENSGAVKNTGGARKSKKTKKIVEIASQHDATNNMTQCVGDVIGLTACKPSANITE